MASFTVPPLILTVSIFSLFVLFIFVYLRFTSEFFRAGRFKRSVVILILVYILSCSTILLLQNKSDHYIRLAVFPPNHSSLSPNNSTAWAIAEETSAQLINSLPQEYLVYPPQWLMQAIDFDSLSDNQYINRFAKQINLDYVIIFSNEKIINDQNLDNFKNFQTTEIKQIHPGKTKKSRAQIHIDLVHQTVDKIFSTGPNLKLSQVVAECLLLLNNQQYGKAVNCAEDYYKTDTSSVKIRNLLAHCFLEAAVKYDYLGKPSGQYKLAALRLCEGTISWHDSLNAKAYQLLGKYYNLEKMWAKAEFHYLKAYNLNNKLPEIYFGFSHLHDSRSHKLGQKNKEALLRKTIKINPCFELARIYLADYLYFNKWPNRARNEINKLLNIHPTSIDGLLYLGKLAVAENKIDQIVAIYNKILDIEPRNVEAFYNLGVYYYNLDNIETAIKFFERSILYGDHLDSHLYLGHIYHSKGQLDKAIEEYRYRIKYKRGKNDAYADEARKRLYNLTDADSALNAFYGRNK